MDNQLPIQKRSNDKEKFLHTVKENLNYIYIVLMFIVNAFISMCTISGGEVHFVFPNTALAWVLWAVQIAISTFLGVMILNAFRRQGIVNGHKEIKETYEEYKKALAIPNKQAKPRSLRKYLSSQAAKDGLSKSLFFMIISSFTCSVLISFNLNNLISLIVSTIMATGFGIVTMLNAEDYVVSELVVWYQLKTDELKKLKEKQDGERNVCELGPSKPSGIQQKEECKPRRTNKELIKSSTRFTKPSTRRLFATSVLWTPTRGSNL